MTRPSCLLAVRTAWKARDAHFMGIVSSSPEDNWIDPEFRRTWLNDIYTGHFPVEPEEPDA